MVVSSDAAIQNTVFGGGVDRMSANGFSRAVVVNAHEFHLDESPKTAVKNTVAERLGGDGCETEGASRFAVVGE